MIQRREHFRFTLESRDAFRVGEERARRHLERDLALQARVRRAPDLAHAPLADLGGDLVRADASAGGQRHVRTLAGIIRTSTSSRRSLRASRQRASSGTSGNTWVANVMRPCHYLRVKL